MSATPDAASPDDFTGKELHLYRCSGCKAVAVASIKANGRDYRCNLCRTPMRFQWSSPVSDARELGFWQRGVVYNPGSQP